MKRHLQRISLWPFLWTFLRPFLRSVRRSSLWFALFISICSGCSLYRSADRDSFDADPLSGAPKGVEISPLSSQCSFNKVDEQVVEDIQILRNDPITEVIIKRKEATCRLEFQTKHQEPRPSPSGQVTDEQLVTRARLEIEKFVSDH